MTSTFAFSPPRYYAALMAVALEPGLARTEVPARVRLIIHAGAGAGERAKLTAREADRARSA